MSRGIDTGPIVLTREVSIDGCATIDDLRERVDAAQLDALDSVVRMLVEQGRAPIPREQRPDEGQQFYRMHADLRALLERRLSGASVRGLGD
jgi:methionyl-tRNA formyltransferase